MAVQSRMPSVQVFNCDEHPNVFALLIRMPDQVGILFRLCEVLLRHSIDISSVKQEWEGVGVVAVFRFKLHVPPPQNAAPKLQNWCHDVEEFIRSCSTEEPPKPEDPRTLEKLSVNPDLLVIASFREPADLDLIPDAKSVQQELVYELEVKCINQAGMLAYLSLVFFRCNFNIRSVSCDTPKKENAWLRFELVTRSLQASQMLRTYLDMPVDKETEKRSSSFSSDIGVLGENKQVWPPGPVMSASEDRTDFKLQSDSEAKLEYHEINLSNGDVYRGQCLKIGSSKKQHGYGTYEYRCDTHASFSMYQGQWKEGKKHGSGTLFYKQGGTYVGQWQANDRHGLGVLLTYEESQSKDSMPGFSYEGEWFSDKMHGLGVKESEDSYFYGTFQTGEQDKGVQVCFDSSSRIAGCEVLEPGMDPKPLLDVLDGGVNLLKDEQMLSSPSVPRGKTQDVLDLAISVTEDLAAQHEAPVASRTECLECTEPFRRTVAGSEDVSWMSSPALRQQAMNQAVTYQSPKSSTAWMASPSRRRASPVRAGYRSPSCSEKASSASTTLPQGGLSAPATPAHPRGPTLPGDAMARSPCCDVEFQMWDVDNNEVLSSPTTDADGASVALPSKAETASRGSPTDSDEHMSNLPGSPRLADTKASPASRRSPAAARQAFKSPPPHSLGCPTRPAPSPGCATRPAPSPTGAADLRTVPSPTRSLHSSRSPNRAGLRALTPERTRVRSPLARKKPVKGPMLWSEEELATFLGCLGLGAAVVRTVQTRKIRGLDQLVQMSNKELRSQFGLTTQIECVVVRKALKRFLELDRWENAVRGRRLADTMDDPNLQQFIVSSKLLRIESEIAQGGFGTVYSGTLQRSAPNGSGGRRVAVKEMKGERHVRLHELLKECHVMASLKHKNICQFIGVCADLQRRQSGRQYIVSELMDCSLFDLIHLPHKLSWNGDLSLRTTLSISQDICSGINFLHEMRLVHADLKSPNILIDYKSSRRPIPKICDFGHVAMRTHPAPHHRCGTPHWAAPEVLRLEAIGPPSDVFSCGVILWETITRVPPHRGFTFGQVAGAVGWAGLLPDMKLVSEVPKRVRAILLHCLEFRPADRPPAREVRAALREFRREMLTEAKQMFRAFIGS